MHVKGVTGVNMPRLVPPIRTLLTLISGRVRGLKLALALYSQRRESGHELSEKSATNRNLCIWFKQNHMTGRIWEAQRENFGHKFTDLPMSKIDDRSHLAIQQFLKLVIFGDLRR